MMKRIILSTLVFLQVIAVSAQIGGKYSYEFLANPQSARLTALGGSLISVSDDDITLAASNPALLNTKMDKQISFNHNFAFADISNGYLGYAHALDSLGLTAHIGISYVSFGDFTAADDVGNDLGTFSGGETAVSLGVSKQMNERIRLGVNLKTIFGNLESFNSVGLGADLGLYYAAPESNFSAAFVVKNIGTELSPYGTERGSLPLDIQLGISRKLNHLPFRFSIIAHQLQQWNIRYDDPDRQEETNIFAEQAPETSAFSREMDNFFRHFIFNGEFLLGKSQGFKLRIGYNHQRRKELSLSNFRSLAGFSAGLGFKVKGLQIDYGLGYFHLAGTANHLSIRTDLGRFFRKF